MRIKVKGKNRIIQQKQIRYQDNKEFECVYKKHNIYISKLKENDFYMSVTDASGMYAVQGGYGGKNCPYGIQTLEDCLKLAIENIL